MTVVPGRAPARPAAPRPRRPVTAAGPAAAAAPGARHRRSTGPTPQGRMGLRDLGPHLRGRWAALGTVAVVSLVAAALSVAQPVVVQAVTDSVVAQRDDVDRLLAVLGAVVVIEAVATATQSYLLLRTGEGVVLSLRTTLVGRLLRLPIPTFDRMRNGDLISRVSGDTTLVRTIVTSGLFTVLSSVLVFGGAVVVMVSLDPVLFLTTLGAVVTGAGVVVAAARALRRAGLETQTRVGEMASAVDRVLSAIRTVRAAGAEEREERRIGEQARRAHDHGVRTARLISVVQPVMSLSTQGAFVLVLVVGGSRVAQGRLTLGELLAFVLYLFLLVTPVTQALSAFTQIQTGLAALDRLQQVLSLPVEADVHAEGLRRVPAQVPVTGPVARPAITFDRVSFSLGGVPVLDDLSFEVPRGSRTALVGPSGAGKSTALTLLERFHEVDSGRILLDGVDVRALDHRRLRRSLAYIEQEAPALAGTVADNLRLRAPHATDEELEEALRAVGLDDLTSSSTRRDGVATLLGDLGGNLSGGQRQRLAWARVLLGDEPVLLLDEPTASVDARTEDDLQATLGRAAAGRTVLVVAHRLSTVRDCDQILVLDRGTVAARGTHDELVRTSGVYRDLARRQGLA